MKPLKILFKNYMFVSKKVRNFLRQYFYFFHSWLNSVVLTGKYFLLPYFLLTRSQQIFEIKNYTLTFFSFNIGGGEEVVVLTVKRVLQ